MGYRFHKAAGIDIVYVPFKGTPATVNGLLTGSVELIYAANVTVAPLIESGKVRALAKLDRRAPPSMANIPTIADAAGLPTSRTCRSGSASSRRRARPSHHRQAARRRSSRSWPIPAIKERSERTALTDPPVRPKRSAPSSARRRSAGSRS